MSVVARGQGVSVSSGGCDVQVQVHFLESTLCLLEKAVDDTPAELPLLLIVVHLQDLFEGGRVDTIATLWEYSITLALLEYLDLVWGLTRDRVRVRRVSGKAITSTAAAAAMSTSDVDLDV